MVQVDKSQIIVMHNLLQGVRGRLASPGTASEAITGRLTGMGVGIMNALSVMVHLTNGHFQIVQEVRGWGRAGRGRPFERTMEYETDWPDGKSI
jgi:hypothetical protein